MERAALTIAAAGGGAKILGPQGGDAVWCAGAALTLQGLAVECRGGRGSAVCCDEKGRAELSGCTLTSPKGNGRGTIMIPRRISDHPKASQAMFVQIIGNKS